MFDLILKGNTGISTNDIIDAIFRQVFTLHGSIWGEMDILKCLGGHVTMVKPWDLCVIYTNNEEIWWYKFILQYIQNGFSVESCC
mgnify:CR=1 FL=1